MPSSRLFPALREREYQVPDPTFAAPASYYSTATSTDGETLKSQLNSIIDGHTNSSYDAATTRLAVLDRDPNNASNLILV